MSGDLDGFLRAARWDRATQSDLAGDASARRYRRLARGDGATAILMQAPVATADDRDSLASFLRVGAHLRGLGLSAPETLAGDVESGLLLLEDFGDHTLARLLERDVGAAEGAYVGACEVLDVLSGAPVPVWAARPDAEGQAGMIGLTLGFLPRTPALASLLPRMAEALCAHAGGPPVLALRDFHADNLVDLEGRAGPARIGLLDYQDAVALPLGYDLASLLDDPRRNVPEAWRHALILRFAERQGLDEVAAGARIAVLSLLRNLRILGIFHRLAQEGGKPRYRAFIPRTCRLVDRAAAHPALAPLAGPVAELRRLTEGWSGDVAA